MIRTEEILRETNDEARWAKAIAVALFLPAFFALWLVCAFLEDPFQASKVEK